MKRKRILVGFLVAMSLVIGASLVLAQIIPYRVITIEVTGIEGQAVYAQVTVDGGTRDFTTTLPTRLTYEAKRLSFQFIPTRPSRDRQITVKTYVNNVSSTTCTSKAVKGGYNGPGVFGLGKRQEWIGGLSAVELAPSQGTNQIHERDASANSRSLTVELRSALS